MSDTIIGASDGALDEKLAKGIEDLIDNNVAYQDILDSIKYNEIMDLHGKNAYSEAAACLSTLSHTGLKAVNTHTVSYLSKNNRLTLHAFQAFNYVKISCFTPEYIKSVTLFMRFSLGNEDDPLRHPTSYVYKPIKKLTSTEDRPFTSNIFKFYKNPIPFSVMVYNPLSIEVEFHAQYPLAFTSKINSAYIVGTTYIKSIQAAIISSTFPFINNLFPE